MITYKNISSYRLTFYNTTFNPNEVKEVPGYINHPKMVRVQQSVVSKPRAIIEAVEPKEETKIEEKPKRSYNRKK